jgi:hypothetical protein
MAPLRLFLVLFFSVTIVFARATPRSDIDTVTSQPQTTVETETSSNGWSTGAIITLILATPTALAAIGHCVRMYMWPSLSLKCRAWWRRCHERTRTYCPCHILISTLFELTLAGILKKILHVDLPVSDKRDMSICDGKDMQQREDDWASFELGVIDGLNKV